MKESYFLSQPVNVTEGRSSDLHFHFPSQILMHFLELFPEELLFLGSNLQINNSPIPTPERIVNMITFNDRVPRRDKLNILLLFDIEKVETRTSVTRINFMLL